jgi:hypothetical protein
MNCLQSLNLTLSFSIILTPNLNPNFKTVGFLGPNRTIFGVGQSKQFYSISTFFGLKRPFKTFSLSLFPYPYKIQSSIQVSTIRFTHWKYIKICQNFSESIGHWLFKDVQKKTLCKIGMCVFSILKKSRTRHIFERIVCVCKYPLDQLSDLEAVEFIVHFFRL